jgi:CDP-glucose 4,6-dehydratase
MNKKFWKDKNVFITGHTGFKGSWLSIWLNELGANVTGYALAPVTDISMFESLSIEKKVKTVFGDIRNYNGLREQIVLAKPEIIIHMAAQALVLDSYNNPIETYQTNMMGTVNILNAIRDVSSVKVFLNVTSDKCYENRENSNAFKEEDILGGSDPYSSSKACSELITAAYRDSFFKNTVAIASARAGNVIGGGDWALNRIIPDYIKKINQNQKLSIRSPKAIRPWQFVLEPLSGYLILAEKLFLEGQGYAEPWNFGPDNQDSKSVDWLISEFDKKYGGGNNFEIELNDNSPHEANHLKLDCSKSIKRLNWAPRLTIDKAISMTCDWYKNFYGDNNNMYTFTLEQIKQFNLNLKR